MAGRDNPDFTDLMNSPRYLCSELVALKNGAGESLVNLEEIWESGAVLELEDAVEAGSKVEIRGGGVQFAGEVVCVERHEFGWQCEVKFSPLTLWSKEIFEPRHLLNVAELEAARLRQKPG